MQTGGQSLNRPSSTPDDAMDVPGSHADMTDGNPFVLDDAALEDDLTDALQTVEQIQTELNYRQAQDVLQTMVTRMDLTERERAGLEHDLASLETMLDKLEQQVVQIVVFGLVGRGKSSLLNALVGANLFATGATHGVTQTIQRVDWNPSSDYPVQRRSLQGVGSSRVELIDTPGIDEVHGDRREAMARQLARQADLILFVVSGDVTRVEREALLQLRQANKPMVLVFNKIDQYGTGDRTAILEMLRDERLHGLLAPEDIVTAAAAPLMTEAVRHADGRVSVQRQRGQPQVDALKLRILDILQRDGKALAALNTMLYANEVNAQIVKRRIDIRERAANDLIWQAVMVKAAAIALNPVMVVDWLGGVAIDTALILALARLYRVPMTQQGAFLLLKTIVFAAGGITAGGWAAILGLGSLKSVLGVATPATGGLALAPYTAIALTQGTLAGGCTYAVGQVAKTYLMQGATWGGDSPKTVIQRILDTLDEASILNRIKEELQLKLNVL